ncbi:unnamed protein product [Paramecium sonneborni]|uniref:Uncharacterized protein n=1 Tax=Paramecium sonneborni TaxID=65129 RepID=A0A8S1RBF6_9CILI|nr:unnamed protein product [Paramecium sonneborni]
MTNELGVGFGAYKFQTIISNEMRMTKDSVHRTRIQTESRKSIQDKCKYQFQNAKKKIIQKLQDPNERERFNTQIQLEQVSNDSVSDDSENQTLQLLEYKKKKEKEYILQAINEPNVYEEENNLAGQNLKTLTTPTILKSPQISQSRVQIAKQKVMAMKMTKYPIVRKDIDFLRSLCQNQNFINNDKAILEEYKLDKEICVDMDCQDIITFMRLQHEVEEMRRKQIEFNTQKERHYEIAQKFNQKTNNKVEDKDNKFWTVMMAKRFIKNMKLKIDHTSPPKHSIQAINLIRKSTRGSILKNQY